MPQSVAGFEWLLGSGTLLKQTNPQRILSGRLPPAAGRNPGLGISRRHLSCAGFPCSAAPAYLWTRFSEHQAPGKRRKPASPQGSPLISIAFGNRFPYYPARSSARRRASSAVGADQISLSCAAKDSFSFCAT